MGDGDLILPLGKNLVNSLLQLSEVCPYNVVQGIYSLLQISPTESPNGKWRLPVRTSQPTHQKRVEYATARKWRHSEFQLTEFFEGILKENLQIFFFFSGEI